MFIDNCTPHTDLPSLKNVKIHFLPANTTSKLQPLDQGIIKNFKVHYRREVVQRSSINVLDAMTMASKAWNNVTTTTIKNCFQKCGFKVANVDSTDVEHGEDEEELVITEVSNTPTGWTEATQALNVPNSSVNMTIYIAVTSSATQH